MLEASTSSGLEVVYRGDIVTIKVVDETRNMLVVDVGDMTVRVPKNPEAIPPKSIYTFIKRGGKTTLKDITPDVKKVVKAYIEEKEKEGE